MATLTSAPPFAALFLDDDEEEGDVMSHDLEDVICVIYGRPDMEDEVRGSATDVRQ